MKKCILLALCMFLSSQTLAYTECNFDNVQTIFLDTNEGGNELVYASLTKPTGGYAAIHKNKNSSLSTDHIGRFYAALLAAYTAGKGVQVRYPENNLNCAALSGGRDDFIGFRVR